MRLTAEGLAVARGGRTVFEGVSFSLSPGELLAVTGANGSGKTTMLRAVAGLLPLVSGKVSLEGAGEAGVSGNVHFLGHLDALKPSLTVLANLAFWRRVWGGNGPTESEALARLGLAGLADLPAGVLSAGQRRRVAIARLLVSRRPLWLLDEPTTALDAAAEATLGTLIAEHLGAGGLVVAATHRPLPAASARTLRLGEAP